MNDFAAKKSLGQHWLNDKASLEAICDAAEVNLSDTILEIGPGKGSLTGHLMQREADIFALEFDPEAVDYLSQVYARQWDQAVHVEQGDIRTFDLNRLNADYKIVANIPYYLTSHLIQIISESNNPPILAVLLIQKEVAERVAAEPGNMSILGVIAQYFWQVSLGRVVPAKLFEPAPKVDSQILILSRREQPLFEVDSKKFFQIVKAGFSSKRKTLLNSLSGGLRISKDETLKILSGTNIDPGYRAQKLSLDDWYKIYVSCEKHNWQST